MAKYMKLNSLSALAIVPLIAACGGGGGGEGLAGLNVSKPTAEAKVYETMDALSAATKTLDVRASKNTETFEKLTATYDANSKSINMTEGDTSLTVLNGLSYVQGITVGSYDGFIGVTTANADMPTSRVSYQGGASASIRLSGSNGLADNTDGNSLATLDVSANPKLTVTMNNFTSSDDTIDTITYETSTFAGSSFSGRQVTTTKSGAAVNVIGNDTVQSLGGLYGPDGQDLAGQVIASQNGSASLIARFFATKQ